MAIACFVIRQLAWYYLIESHQFRMSCTSNIFPINVLLMTQFIDIFVKYNWSSRPTSVANYHVDSPTNPDYLFPVLRLSGDARMWTRGLCACVRAWVYFRERFCACASGESRLLISESKLVRCIMTATGCRARTCTMHCLHLYRLDAMTDRPTSSHVIRYDTIWYGRLTCAQQLTGWPA